MSVAARVQAQAKVNLFLNVFAARDDDGYHSLWTAFQRIDLADDVVIRLGGSARSLDAVGPAMPREGLGPVERNLAYRAAVAFLDEAGSMLPSGFSIELIKNIPVGGGLGGGSADAGAVLRALNAMSPRPLPGRELGAIAASLGSDVPFLTSELVTAQALGRGDRFLPVGWAPVASPMVLVVPDFAVATKDAYGWLDDDRPTDPYGDVTGFGALETFPGWSDLARGANDFEPVVERRHPILREYRERLLAAGARLVRMAGSGSTVFGIFDETATLPTEMGPNARVIHTRTSARVVQVEVLQ